jgi:hypothetical protein
MPSQVITSSKQANNNSGLCPIKGQMSGLCSRTRTAKLILEPVSEYCQDLDTLPSAGYPSSFTVVTFRKIGTSRISVYNYTYRQGKQLKSKLHHIGNLSATARLPHHLCYRPGVFFRHLSFPCAFIPARKNSVFSRTLLFHFYFTCLKSPCPKMCKAFLIYFYTPSLNFPSLYRPHILWHL